jgi:hypothetical protein
MRRSTQTGSRRSTKLGANLIPIHTVAPFFLSIRMSLWQELDDTFRPHGNLLLNCKFVRARI